MYEKMEQLARKTIAWGENWSVSDMEYSAEYNEITVWACRPDCYKAFFDADTLECTGTKC